MNGYQTVRMSDDLLRYEVQQEVHHRISSPERKERVRKVAGQEVRVRFSHKDENDHVYWLVHPEDAARLAPGFVGNPALTCECVVECD